LRMRPAMYFFGSLFRALQRLNDQRLLPNSPLLPMLAQSWLTTDPPQGAVFAKTFVETTYGATIDRALPRVAATLAQAGRLGDREAFIEQLKPARTQLAAIEERVDREPGALTGALGPALWLAATPTRVVNLNTAEADQLASLDYSPTDRAARIVAERERRGPYDSLADLARRVRLPAPVLAALNDMAAKALVLGTYPRL
jgi:DNA uptake protein ComE-like DNA-binding protein